MQDKISLLKDLQGLDQELNHLVQGHQKLEIENKALQDELDRVQSMVDGLAAEIEQLQAQQRELSQGLALEQENVKKAEGRLPAIKTQKEYVAVLKEIDTAKKVNKDLLDRIEEKTGEIDALNRDREEKESELATVGSRVRERQGEIAAAWGEDEKKVAVKSKQRDALLEQLPLPLRKRYQLLMERRGGVAVVEARNGACLGCNMQLPPQLYNSLFRAGEMQSCPHCSRLLFVLPSA
ncbi:MAG: C4-type zinc ribbon domain-containing protein [Desulfuromonadales bacterium]